MGKPRSVAVYLGLGSNLGNRQGNLVQAVSYLGERVNIGQVSSLYETEPVGYREQPWFLNAVCRGATQLSPEELLDFAKEIESDLGRVSGFRNAPRPIDIDILLYGNLIVGTPQLIIPHPRLAERAFVLVPLAEIAPDLVHPVSQKTVRELLAEIKDVTGVRKVEPTKWECDTLEGSHV